ncbi:hypothetical protein CSUI_005495 [Cystoisospora suis]|uniref:SWI2/SNF2-containing protein n=1 Tax=Cystoisospora suis TaxID=483139 RepID=A0A2C6KXC3_9APIC|nr:hypothetical protein CSUI_005495 [Cystoisospora suis]
MAPSSASLLRQRRFHNLRECLPVAGQVPCRVAGEGGEARALICEADAPEPAEACGLVSSKIALEVSVALEVCSGTTFRVVAQRSVSSGGRKREGGTKASGGGWISRLPVELWIPLKALGPLPFREVSGMDSPSALFSAEKYDRVLNLLLQRFSLSDVRPIPPFVLRCFRAFMPFAPAVPLPRKTAHVLLGDKGDATDTAGLVSTAYPRLGGRGLQGAQQSEEREDIKARNPDAAELLENLKPFQVEGYLFGLKREGRLLIGDEMGLGKTLQALAIAAFYNREWPLLIVCPSSIRFQWRDQALRWLPRLLSAEHVCIVENGRTDIPEETRMVVVICDESHYLKNRQAKRTQVLCPLLRNAKRAILLSGTPALNKPVELYQQIDALLPDLCSYHEFADRYSVKVWNHFTRRFEHEGHQHAEELHVLLKKTIMIRRLKQQVHTELPPKIRSRVPVQIPVKELKEIRDKMEELSADGSAYKRDGADDDEDFLNGSAGSPLITELFTLTGLAKRQGVSEYLSYLFQGDPDLKLIVFGHHRAVLDHVEEHLKTKEKKRYVRIDGSTSQDKRESLVKEFQTSRECQVAILSITACGHGLNLTAAGTVVFAELYWVPGQMIQAEDRSHRIGNEFGCVQIHYLIAEGTLDETVFRTLQRKWGVMTSTLDGQQQHLAMDSHGPRRFLPPGCPRLSEPSSEGPSGVSPVLNTSRTGRCSSNPGDAVGQKGQKRLDAFLRGTAKGKEGDRSDAMNADVAKELEINESGSEAGTPGGPGARKRRRV